MLKTSQTMSDPFPPLEVPTMGVVGEISLWGKMRLEDPEMVVAQEAPSVELVSVLSLMLYAIRPQNLALFSRNQNRRS